MKEVLKNHKDPIINQAIATIILFGIFAAALYILPKPF